MKHEKITQGLNLLKHNELTFQLWKNYTKTIDIQSRMNFTIYICLDSSPTYGLIINSHFMGLIKILRHVISYFMALLAPQKYDFLILILFIDLKKSMFCKGYYLHKPNFSKTCIH
jgi:hypothetical protein